MRNFTPNFGVMGFYNFTVANSDGGNGSNPSNSYNLSQDYGRASLGLAQHGLPDGQLPGPMGHSLQSLPDRAVGQAIQHHHHQRPDRRQLLQRPAIVCQHVRSARPTPADTYKRSLAALTPIPHAGQSYTPFPSISATARPRSRESARQPRHRHWSQAAHRAKPGGPPQQGGGLEAVAGRMDWRRPRFGRWRRRPRRNVRPHRTRAANTRSPSVRRR